MHYFIYVLPIYRHASKKRIFSSVNTIATVAFCMFRLHLDFRRSLLVNWGLKCQFADLYHHHIKLCGPEGRRELNHDNIY